MYTISIQFHDELNFFLPSRKRDRAFEFSYTGKRSVKDLIESMGIPHVEVDVIAVRGASVDFSYLLEQGDAVDVYPYRQAAPVRDALRLMPPPGEGSRFILDVHLRKLSRSLRLLGFDVLFDERLDDREIAEIAAGQDRMLLTRDRRLLMRKIVRRGLIVRSTDPGIQVVEVMNRLFLWDRCDPFTRCIECNGMIEMLELTDPVNGDAALLIPPGVRAWCREYYRCGSCRRIYWKGSHYDRLRARTGLILGSRGNNG